MKCIDYFLDYEYDDEYGLHPVHLCWPDDDDIRPCPHMGDGSKCQRDRYRYERRA